MYMIKGRNKTARLSENLYVRVLPRDVTQIASARELVSFPWEIGSGEDEKRDSGTGGRRQGLLDKAHVVYCIRVALFSSALS